MISRFLQTALSGASLWVLCLAAVFADGELQFADLGECPTESGDAVRDCLIGYRTLGRVNEDRSNVMVVPTWYVGTTEDLIKFGYIGPGRIADTDRYFVVAVDAFSNGVSSSPSNSATQPLAQFPRISLGDMVDAQFRLLTEKLELDHVRVVLGVSMGGMQTFEWMVRYPKFMDYAVSIEGTPWPTSYDLLLWSGWRSAGAGYDGSEESLRRSSVLLAQLDALTLWTPDHFLAMVDKDQYADYMQAFTPRLNEGSLLDRNSQTEALLDHNIAKNYPDFAERASYLIKAEVFTVVFSRDLMVNPSPSLELAARIGAKTLVLDSPCGHMGPAAECVQQEVAVAVNGFLMD